MSVIVCRSTYARHACIVKALFWYYKIKLNLALLQYVPRTHVNILKRYSKHHQNVWKTYESYFSRCRDRPIDFIARTHITVVISYNNMYHSYWFICVKKPWKQIKKNRFPFLPLRIIAILPAAHRHTEHNILTKCRLHDRFTITNYRESRPVIGASCESTILIYWVSVSGKLR